MNNDKMIDTLRKATPGKVNEDDNADDSVLKEIDWKGLEDHLSDLLKVKITVETSIERGLFIEWEAKEELVSHSGIFQLVLESVKVGSFSSSRVSEVRKNNQYWCTADIRFEIKDGGGNGVKLFTAWYDLTDKKWTFR